jgi:hypothetical protein
MELNGPSIGNCAADLCMDILRPKRKLYQYSTSNRLTCFSTDSDSGISMPTTSSMTPPTASSVVSSLGSRNLNDSGTASNTDNNSDGLVLNSVLSKTIAHTSKDHKTGQYVALSINKQLSFYTDLITSTPDQLHKMYRHFIMISGRLMACLTKGSHLTKVMDISPR